MTQNTNHKSRFDLEERTQIFAHNVRTFVRQLPKTVIYQEDGRQLIRSSGSIGANYIEANDALGKKDFMMRIRIARKEAKEARYWLSLFDKLDDPREKERKTLEVEATELIKILSAI